MRTRIKRVASKVIRVTKNKAKAANKVVGNLGRAAGSAMRK